MTTGLDQALIDWWQATATLVALIPVDRVASEVRQSDEQTDDDRDEDGHFDDCVVFSAKSELHWKTNSQTGWKSSVMIDCFSVDYDRSKAIAQAVSAAWNNTTFTGTGSIITLARLTGLASVQDAESGIWNHSATFSMNHNGL